ncbi:MAG: hypothetical protein D4R66_07010, partial [Opitutales bacterium]
MKFPKTRPLFSRAALMAASVLLSLAVPKISKAANYYWDADGLAAGNNSGTGAGLGGSSVWDDSTAKWWDGVSAADVAWPNQSISADSVIFTGTAGTVTVGGSVGIFVRGLTFNTSGYVLAGDSSHALILSTSSPSITLGTGVSQATIAAFLGGSNGFTFNGGASAGTLLLGATASGSNYNGIVDISSGVVRTMSLVALGWAGGAVDGTNVNAGGALRLGIGGTSSEYVTLAGTGVGGTGALILDPNLAATLSVPLTVDASGATINIGTGATLTLSGGIVATGNLTKTGNGTLLMTSVASSGTGTLTVNAGIFSITSATTVTKWHSGNITVNNGGTFRVTGSGTDSIPVSGVNAATVSPTLTINAGGGLDWQQTGAETLTSISLSGTGLNNAGALLTSAATAGGAITASSGINLAAAATIGAYTGGSLKFVTGITTGGFTLTKAGAGSLIYTANSGTPWGVDALVLNTGSLVLLPGAASAATYTGANAAVGTTFTYAGGNTLTLTKNTTSTLLYTIGNAGASANSVLVRGASSRGTLVLAPTALANLGVAATFENFVVRGNTTAANKNGAATAAGIYDASVVATGTGAFNATFPGQVGTFVQYQASNGFGAATYTTAVNNATIAATTISDVAASLSLATGSNPYALRVGGLTATATSPTGNTTLSSATVAALSSTAGLQIGSLVTGSAFPAATSYYVTAIDSVAGTVTLSTGTGVLALTGTILNFTPPTVVTNSGTTTINGVASGVNNSGLGGLILNTTTGYAIVTGATLAFGASEGAIFTPNTFGLGQITSAITGTAGVTKFGVGTLVLDGNNTFTGGLQLNQGTLNINSTTALGAAASVFTIKPGTTINNTTTAALTLTNNNPIGWEGDFTFTGTQSLNLGAGAVTLAGNGVATVTANTLTFGGAISGSGSITKLGVGTIVLGGSNTGLTGGVTLSAGVLQINHANALGATAGAFTVTAASTIGNSSGASITNAGNNPINIQGTGTLTLTSTLANDLNLGTGAVTLGGGVLTISSTGAVLTLGGNIGDNGTNIGFTKSGAGTMVLTGSNNTFTGPLTVTAGALSFASLADGVTYGGGIGNLAFNSTASLITYTGSGLTLVNRQLSLIAQGSTSNATTSNTQYLSSSGSGPLIFANTSIIPQLLAVVNLRFINLGGTNTGSNTIAGIFANQDAASLTTAAFGIIKSGTGNWGLTNNNTYTGTTTVIGGVLHLNATSTPAPSSGVLAAGSSLSLGGGTLKVTGAATNTTQTFFATTLGSAQRLSTAGTAFNEGNTQSTLEVVAGVGTLTVNTGAITRKASAGLNIIISGSPVINLTSGLATANGLIAAATTSAAFVTLNSTDWATLSGTNPVAATYTNDIFTTSANNINVTTTATWAGTTLNSLRFNSGTPAVLTLTGANVLTSGGILIGSGAGTVDIGGAGGGTLAGTTFAGVGPATYTTGELNIFNFGGVATINAKVINNSSGASYLTATTDTARSGTSLSIFGTGTVLLNTTNNAYTGGTNISGTAILKMGQNNALPFYPIGYSATIISTGAKLDLNGTTQVLNGLAGFGKVDNTSVSAINLFIGAPGTSATGDTSMFNGVIQNTGGAISIYKLGKGRLSFFDKQLFTGSTTINEGNLRLFFSDSGAVNGLTANMLPVNALTIGSATLELSGSTSYNIQNFTSLTLAGSAKVITSGTTPYAQINLGPITRPAGTGLAFYLGTSPSALGFTSTTTANTGTSILGGWAVAGATSATSWAVSAGNGSTAGAITALANFLTTTIAGNTAGNYLTTSDVDVTTSPTLSAGITVNSLRLNFATALTLTLTGVNTINTGGILNGASSASTTTVSGGSLQPGAGNELIFNQYGAGTLVINSAIVDGASPTNVTLNGTGTLQLRGTNTFTGAVVINGGTYDLSVTGNTGSPSSYTLNGGILSWNGTFVTAAPMSLGPAGGTFNTSGATGTQVIFSSAAAVTMLGIGPRTLTITGGTDSRVIGFTPVLGDATGGVTGLTLAEGGDTRLFRLYGVNTYTGLTLITRGILDVNQVANSIAGGFTSAATTGNIVFAATGTNRAILSLGSVSGDFTRSLGYGAGQVHWEGNGGFSNNLSGSNVVMTATQNVNLGGAASQLTWGAGGFVPTGYLLQFGHAGSTGNTVAVPGAINFQNAIQLGTSSRTLDVSFLDMGVAIYQAELSGVLSTQTGGGLTKSGVGTLLVTNAGNAAASVGATVTLSQGALVFSSVGAILGSGANLTLSIVAGTNASIGLTGDTNPISTFGSRIANPSTSTAAFLLGADSSATLDFTNFPNMRLAAFQYTPGATPSGILIATTFTGTIVPANSTYLLGGRYATLSLASGLSTSTLVLGSKNILTGANAANFTFGQTALADSNNYTGGTVINGNAIAPVRIGVGSNAAFGTGTISIQGTQTTHLGTINGDHTLSNNISFDAISTGGLEFAADPGSGGMLNNPNQGTISYLGTVDFGGRVNPTITGRPRGGLFLGDMKNATGLNYTQGSGGYLSLLSTSTNGGVAKSFTGTLTIGNDSILVIDSPSSLGSATVLNINSTNYSTLQLQGAGTITLSGSLALSSVAAGAFMVNTPSGATLTIPGSISGLTTGVFYKTGLGTLVLSGNATGAISTGSLQVRAGTLRLDAATRGSSVWTAGLGLTLGVASGTFGNGGTLEITGTSAQTFGAVTVNPRANAISLTGNMALTLGAITRTTGSTLNLSVPTGTVVSTTTALQSLVNGATTWNGDDWAAASGSAITRFTAYDALTGTSSAPTITTGASITTTKNYIISSATTNNVGLATAGTLLLPVYINTIKYNDTLDRTLNIGSTGFLRLGTVAATGGVTTAGGILVASGSGALTIGVSGSAGTIMAGGTTTSSGLGDLVFINNSTSNITVNSVISYNGATTAVTHVAYNGIGPGKLILNGANTFNGTLFINSGTLEVATVNLATVAGPLGLSTKAVGNILLNGGTFRANLSANGTTDHGFTINAPSTIEVVANTLTLTTTLNGVATANQQREILNAGILKKTGAGTLELKDLTTNANNTNLSIEVVAGSLLLNKVSTSVISAIDLIGGAGLIIDGVATGAAPTVKLSGTGGNQISDSSSVVVNSGTVSGVFDLNGLSETIDGLAGGGSVTNTLGSTTSTLSLGGNNSAGLSAYTLAASAAGVNSTGLNSFSGALSDGAGTLALTKVGSGTQILSGPNTYSGLTTISAGTLQMGADNVLPSGAGKLAVTIIGTNKGSIGVASTSNGSDRLFAPGTLDLGGFNLTLNGLNSTTGGFVTSNPTLAYNGSVWAVAAGRQSAKNLTLGAGDASASFSGVIRDGYTVAPGVTSTAYVGVINLIKLGGGTQTLSGANTFSGSTSVQAGILALAGADNRLSSSATVTLGNGSDSGFLQLGNASAAISQQIAGLAVSGSGANNAVVGGYASGNSTLILNLTGSSTYAGGLGGVGANQNKLNFTLQGGGSLTLSGANNTLTGTTTVKANSTLILANSYASSPIVLGGTSTGTLVSNQTISGLVTVNAFGVIAPGATVANDLATITLAGGLTMNTGGTLSLQVGTTGGSAPQQKDIILVSGGTLTFNGGKISLLELAGPNGVTLGTYDLINYTGASLAGSGISNLSLSSSVIGVNNYYVTLQNDSVNHLIQLVVDNARFWSGATNSIWNTSVANWSPANFFVTGDKVLFRDTFPTSSGAPSVVNSTVQLDAIVTPAAVTFSNSLVNYVLQGSGAIDGSTGLTKGGTGGLTIINTNTFSGNTIISEAGYIEMQNAGALGTIAGSITVNDTATLRLSGGISVGAKALTLIGAGNASGGALRNISGNNSYAGGIALGGSARINSDADTLTLSGALNNGTSTLIFGGAGNVTVSGIIGSGSGSLVVDGTGVVTLSNAANTYTGQTFIKNGTLSVSNIGSVSVAGGFGAPTTAGDGTIAIGDVANTGTLRWTRSSNETSDRVIDLAGTTGGATIDASGSGVLTLSSAVTATGVGAKSLTLTGTTGTTGTPNVISSGISDGSSAVISLIKTGTGVWRLNGSNNYTGSTTVSNGTLMLGANQNFSALTLGGLSGGTATLALGSSSTATLTGNVTFSAANNPSGATISGSGVSTLDLNAATRTFIVGSSSSANGADLTISAVIADALTGGALTKTGAGSLVLTGANSFTGTITVDGGTLSVSPQAISGSLTINVSTNSTAGALNFYADGAVGAVNLASNANLNIGGASVAGGLGFNLSGSTADKVAFSGTGILTVGATGGLINARALAPLNNGSYTLIDASNNGNTALITGFTLGVLTGGYSYTLDNNTGGLLKLTVGTAAAGPYYWTGARSTTSWAALASNGTTSNWATVSAAGTDAGATPGNIDVIFTLGTAVNTTLDQPYAISGLTFAGSSAGNGNVAINAGSGDGLLTMGANGITVSTGASSSATTIGANVALSSAQSWSVADSGQTLTVSGIISGNGNLLTKSGSGTLVLTGVNTFNGGLTANAGTVKVNNANSLGAVSGRLTLNNATLQATAGFTVSRNVTLGHANSAIMVDTTQTLTYANTVSTKLTGTGVLNASGAGKLVLDDRLNANDFNGGSILSGGGTVQVYGLASLGLGNITLNNGTLQVSGTFTDARMLTVGNAASAISVDSGQTFTVSGKITGTGNLNTSGAGVLVLNDSVLANDFIGNSVLSGGGTVQVASLTALGTGSITINAATLQATTSLSYSGKNFILGYAASALTVASGDTFTITNSGSTRVSGSGVLNANVAGILVLNDTLNPNTFSGGSVLSGGGTVKINSATSLGGESGAAALKDITLQVTADITTTRNFTLGSYVSQIIVDSGKTLAVSGTVNDGAQAGTLTKTGNGKLDLSGGNGYTGGTTVSAGTLNVSNVTGSATGTGDVSVTGSSTVLSGTGTISGAVTVATGVTLSPGSSVTAGTLTLGGLSLSSGSKLSYQLGANTSSSDKTVVTGTNGFTANGGVITLDTTTLAGFTGGTYNLITYAGTLGGSFSNLSLTTSTVY